MRSLSATYQQKNDVARRGFNQLAQAESARNAQNAQIKQARKQQQLSGAVSMGTLAAQATGGNPYATGIAAGLGLLLG